MHAIILETAARKVDGFTPIEDLKTAESLWADMRQAYGFRPNGKARLLTPPDAQHKVGLNDRPTWSLALTAGVEGGLCTNDKACRAVCVLDSGNGRYQSVRRSREARTAFLLTHPEAFGAILQRDIRWMARRGVVDGRPNAASDLAWEIVFPWLADLVASNDGALYDYTKRRNRVGYLASNYRVTYSATASTREETVRAIVGNGDTVTMVLPVKKGQPLPASWRGLPMVDGDISDDRFRDPRGVIVGLRAKGGLRGLSAHPLLSPVA
jgi:hypothetical protein